MKIYIFSTRVSANGSDVRISENIVGDFTISANNLIEAEMAYFSFVKEIANITIPTSQANGAFMEIGREGEPDPDPAGFAFFIGEIGIVEIVDSIRYLSTRYVTLHCEIKELAK